MGTKSAHLSVVDVASSVNDDEPEGYGSAASKQIDDVDGDFVAVYRTHYPRLVRVLELSGTNSASAEDFAAGGVRGTLGAGSESSAGQIPRATCTESHFGSYEGIGTRIHQSSASHRHPTSRRRWRCRSKLSERLKRCHMHGAAALCCASSSASRRETPHGRSESPSRQCESRSNGREVICGRFSARTSEVRGEESEAAQTISNLISVNRPRPSLPSPGSSI